MKKRFPFFVLLSLAALAATALATIAQPATAQPAADRFEPLDVFELEYAADVQIAPDGKRIVYVRTSMDIMKDRRQSDLWIIGADGSDHRPLTTGPERAAQPRWSPDGRRLAFVSTADGQQQLFIRWMDTGLTAPITKLPSAPGGIAWSPDGAWIAFTMHVDAPLAAFAPMPRKPDGAEWAAAAKVISTLQYRADGAGYLKAGHRHLFVVPAEGGSPRQLTDGPHNHGGTPAWTPDSQALVFSANRHDDAEVDPVNSEVYAVTLADGRITPLTQRQGPDTTPVVSPNGRHIAYLGYDDRLQGYQLTRLYVMDRDGTNARSLTDGLDRSVQRAVWRTDGRGLYIQYTDEGVTKVAFQPLAGTPEVLVDHVGGLSLGRPYASGTFSVAHDGRIAYTHSRPDRPADVAVYTPGAAPRVLTGLNEDLLGHKTLGAVEEIWYTSSFDGRRVQGWIVTPPGFDAQKKYPLLLEIHGGPFSSYGPHFAAEVQLFAAAGYVVLYTNPRGSTSYGEAFGNLIHHNYPGQDYDDLMSGVDAVLERGYVDPDHLYVTGGSGGGVLTSWIIGKTNRFRAAVVAKPVINWTSFALTADNYNFYYKYWFPGTPWDHPEHYWQRSPLSLVGNVTTPTMLITGESDYRTPISETEQYYQALKLVGVEAVMVRIPGASHGIATRPSNLIAKVAHILHWFNLHRGDLSVDTTTG